MGAKGGGPSYLGPGRRRRASFARRSSSICASLAFSKRLVAFIVRLEIRQAGVACSSVKIALGLTVAEMCLGLRDFRFGPSQIFREFSGCEPDESLGNHGRHCRRRVAYLIAERDVSCARARFDQFGDYIGVHVRELPRNDLSDVPRCRCHGTLTSTERATCDRTEIPRENESRGLKRFSFYNGGSTCAAQNLQVRNDRSAPIAPISTYRTRRHLSH